MDDEPCPYPLGHVRQVGGMRFHRVYSPYGDGRWRDFTDAGRLEAFGGPWSAVEVVELSASGARFAGRHAGEVRERVTGEPARLGEPSVPGRRAARMTATGSGQVLGLLGVRGHFIVDATGELVGATTTPQLAAALVDAHNAGLQAKAARG